MSSGHISMTTERTRFFSNSSPFECISTDYTVSNDLLTMPCMGKARVGHKAPNFECEGVIAGAVQGE
jgi:hypothetical protein